MPERSPAPGHGARVDDPGARLLADALGLDAGDSPFPWQLRLLDQLLGGSLPRSLDIPTGLGKTATMAIWLIARALGAPLPRRLIYVVDRRAVVDQATDVALRLRDWVAADPQLQDGLGLRGRPLPISTLRGQFVDNREWLEDPSDPAIVVGTVDMVGSRLLFQGYGTSRKMRPYHAGLVGNDALVVLDEAHLVPPFERLLESIAFNRADLGPVAAAKLASPPPLRLLSLSATGRSHSGQPFDLDDADLRHRVVDQRLSATKRLTMAELPAGVDLSTAVAQRAWDLAEHGALPVRCIVYTTSRDCAEKALAALRTLAGLHKLGKGQEPAADVELLVGGRRVFERGAAATRLQALGFLAGTDTPRRRPAFLFSTSAGEVGVDLDADHMVCDLVPWERMVQRLGRVNRRGQGDACVQVVVEPLPDKAEPADLARRQSLLALVHRLPVLHASAHDASPGALRQLQRTGRQDGDLALLIDQASTPAPLHPALDRPTLDAWSMTSLQPHPGRPTVGPWLRGWVDDRPQTSLLWRTHLPSPEDGTPRNTDLLRFFEAAPPHASEKLDTESYRVADWLDKRAKRLLKQVERSATDETVSGLRRDTIVATSLRDSLQNSGDDARTWSLQQLVDTPKKQLAERDLTGVTLVLDARLAGLDAHGLLDPAHDAPPPTLDGSPWLGEPTQGAAPAVRFRVRLTTDDAAITDPTWRERDRFPLARGADGEVVRWLLVEKWRHSATTEDDRSAGRPQLLADHLAWTADHAQQLAARLGLGPEATRVLVIAAQLHDEGKAARRWQAAFHAPSDGVYAKTRGPVNVHLLDGYRHEFGSLPIAQASPALADLPDDQRELVLHLIASHHGFARPVISTRGCQDAPPSALEERAADVAMRFLRLQQRWGPWGLAWWESLLRAADQQASRANDAADLGPAQKEQA